MNISQVNPYLANDLLRTLGPEVGSQLFPKLELVTLKVGDEIFRPGDALEHVYFPVDCLLSVVSQVSDGKTVEATMVGINGLAPIDILVGIKQATSTLVVQISGRALRVPTKLFEEQLNPRLRELLAPFAFNWFRTSLQTPGCLVYHSSDRRLARWLLTVQDSIRRSDFSLTHEYLATMVGVQRPTVSLSMKTLADSGAISYRYGKITIVDRELLIDAACDCYEAAAD